MIGNNDFIPVSRIEQFKNDVLSLHDFKRMQFTPDCMKRFMFSVLRAGAESDTPAIGKGLSMFVGQMLFNIYDFEDLNPANFELNDAHWEIVGQRWVNTTEIAAQCMSAVDLANHIAEGDHPARAEVSVGVLIGAMSFADIMKQEILEGNAHDC